MRAYVEIYHWRWWYERAFDAFLRKYDDWHGCVVGHRRRRHAMPWWVRQLYWYIAARHTSHYAWGLLSFLHYHMIIGARCDFVTHVEPRCATPAVDNIDIVLITLRYAEYQPYCTLLFSYVFLLHYAYAYGMSCHYRRIVPRYIQKKVATPRHWIIIDGTRLPRATTYTFRAFSLIHYATFIICFEDAAIYIT